MNRRSLLTALAALTGSAAATPVIGAKTAAALAGVSLATNEPAASNGNFPGEAFWKSGLSMRIDAAESASFAVSQGRIYPQFKSWGHGFRAIVAEREEMAIRKFKSDCVNDDGFWQKVAGLIGGEP